MDFDADAYLSTVGQSNDSDINLFKASIALAAVDHDGVSLDKYFNHLNKLCKAVKARHENLLKEGANDDAGTQLAALKHIIADQEGYTGDVETYDDLQNADLIRVIDRRRGMPIALSVLYIQVGRELGWELDGLNMPGHFVCRVEKDGERLIFDPFDCAKTLNAADLRALLKKTQGDFAELSAKYYEAAPNRDILIRLQNNIKLRLIENEEYEKAAMVVEAMRKIDPDEFRLLLDAGVLYARVGQHMAAARCLEGYIDKAPNPRDRQEAAILLQQLRDILQ
ncbi:MAG: transglutaminase-like domain-containing protein [Pseudomonadota bacterium]